MTIGTGNTNHPKCIRLKSIQIGIMRRILTWVISPQYVTNSLCCPPLKKYLRYSLYMNDIVLKNVHTPCCALFSEVFK